MKFFRRHQETERCGMPFCENPAAHTLKLGKDLHHFCAKHYSQARLPQEALRNIDEKWLTRERKRRMFDPTAEEKKVMDDLVKKNVLEPHLRQGKATFRPAERFAEEVAGVEVDIMGNHAYRASMFTIMEEGVRIAIRHRMPDVTPAECATFAEITTPFVLFDQMDRDLNRFNDRYRHGKSGNGRGH